jgi:DNA (cytosine-5)-methyltransferase 1
MRVVDLFCGCGGLSLGFQKAGFEVVAAYDKWETALKVYRLNFGHPAQCMDLSDVGASAIAIDMFEPDMIIGGPPCQDFSSAGKRNEDGGRGDLTIHFAQIINRVRPKWFVMENVARITKTQKLVEAKAIFKKAGYGLSQHVLDASLCGVPQQRKRFFLIGKLHETDGFMEPFINSGLAAKPMTLRDYFGNSLGIDYYYRHPRSYVRRGIFSIDEPSPTIRGVNRPMPEGYKIHPNDPVESKEGIRPLTTLERSYVQTFPRSFKFIGSKTDLEQMIGNAVPVNLAKFVATSITKYIASPHLHRNLEIDFENGNIEERLALCASEPLGAEAISPS